MLKKSASFLTIFSTVAITIAAVAAISKTNIFSIASANDSVKVLHIGGDVLTSSDFNNDVATFSVSDGFAHFKINGGAYLSNGITSLSNGGTLAKYYNGDYEKAKSLKSITVDYDTSGGKLSLVTAYNASFAPSTWIELIDNTATSIAGNYFYLIADGAVDVLSIDISFGCTDDDTPDAADTPYSFVSFNASDLAGFEEVGGETLFYVNGTKTGTVLADNLECFGDSTTMVLNTVKVVNMIDNGYKAYFNLTNYLNDSSTSFAPHLRYGGNNVSVFNPAGDVRVETGSGIESYIDLHCTINNQKLQIAYFWGLPTVRKVSSWQLNIEQSSVELLVENDTPYIQFSAHVLSSSLDFVNSWIDSHFTYLDIERDQTWNNTNITSTKVSTSVQRDGYYEVSTKYQLTFPGYILGNTNYYFFHVDAPGSNLMKDLFDNTNDGMSVTNSLYTITFSRAGGSWYNGELWLTVTSASTAFSYSLDDADVIEENGKPVFVASGSYENGTISDLNNLPWLFQAQKNGNYSGDWDYFCGSATKNITADQNEHAFTIKYDISDIPTSRSYDVFMIHLTTNPDASPNGNNNFKLGKTFEKDYKMINGVLYRTVSYNSSIAGNDNYASYSTVAIFVYNPLALESGSYLAYDAKILNENGVPTYAIYGIYNNMDVLNTSWYFDLQENSNINGDGGWERKCTNASYTIDIDSTNHTFVVKYDISSDLTTKAYTTHFGIVAEQDIKLQESFNRTVTIGNLKYTLISVRSAHSGDWGINFWGCVGLKISNA